MKSAILTVLFLSILNLTSATVTIELSIPDGNLLVSENDAKVGNVAYNFTVTSNPPSVCDYEYATSSEYEVTGSGGVDDTPGEGTVTFKQDLDYEVKPISNTFITASMSCDLTESAKEDIKVLLEDFNDNPPYFIDTVIQEEYDENLPNLLITILEVKDFDESTDFNAASVNFNIVDDYDGLFILSSPTLNTNDTMTVQLRTAEGETLDFEENLSYRVEVIATDCSGCAGQFPYLAATAAVTITVRDGADQKPFFTKSVPYVEIEENVPMGQSITTVKAIDGDRGIDGEITYTIEPNSPAAKWYTIDSNGLITVKEVPDREDPGYSITGMALTIRASEVNDPSSFADTAITIRLLDVDDSKPTFSQPTYSGTVSESATLGFPVTMANPLTVKDADDGDNARYQLSIVEEDSPFAINPTTGILETTFSIVVNGVLDYETQKVYTFTVQAEDVDDATKFNTALIDITLINTNDNAPEFDMAFTKCEDTPESADIGTVLCTVKATDKDDEGTNTIQYTRVTGSLADYLNLDPLTGDITLNTKDVLDYETYQTYQLTVEARDNNGAGLTSIVPLQLTILDTNDNNPSFNPLSYKAVLEENAPDFIIPLTITATDRDSGLNRQLTYSIVPSPLGDNFEVKDDGAEGGTVTLKEDTTLDYENLIENIPATCTSTKCTFDFHVMATDGGTPPRSSTATVTVTVQDVNDVPPVFNPKTYLGSVKENDGPGTSITTVTATDGDGTAIYSRIKYRLDSGGDQQFTVNSDTGVLTVSPSAFLDTEVRNKTEYIITILAEDGENSDSCTVTVTVTDVNNKAPHFEERTPTANTLEGDQNTRVTTLRATDTDLDAALVYSINFDASQANAPTGGLITPEVANLQSHFTIIGTTGEIRTTANSAVDREVMGTITLAVTVHDSNALPGYDQTDEVRLVIAVLDVNDNNPIFSSNEYHATVDENAQPLVIINVDIVATDIDENNTVIYSLDPDQANNNFFTINEEIGDIYVGTQVIDWETMKSLTVLVTASDTDTPSLSSTATVSFTVIDKNDNVPQFIGTPYTFSILEHTDQDTFQLQSQDADEPVDVDDICYMITPDSPGKPYFDIDKKTGVISVIDKDNLDYDVPNVVGKYDLIVNIWDSCYEAGADQNSNSATVTVSVTDDNDNPPVIVEQQNPPKTVSETTNVGVVVYNVTASDADENGAQILQYTMTGDNSDLFDIDSASGKIKVKSDLHSQIDTFTYTVLVNDVVGTSAGLPQTSTTTVILKVLDENTDTPDIISPDPLDPMFLNETAPIGFFVFQVEATDGDEPGSENSRITYSIANTDQVTLRAFHIHSVDGTVTLINTVDRETTPTYHIIVYASDNGVPQLHDEETFTVVILNENDEEPVFNQSDYKVSFKENSTESTIPVDIPLATDPDHEDGIPSPDIFYFLVYPENVTKYFILDKDNNTLSVISATSLDHEQPPPTYKDGYMDICIQTTNVDMEIIPSDNPCDRQLEPSPFLIVNVTILDENDNPPNFVYSKYIGGLSTDQDYSNSPPIMQTNATDLDAMDKGKLKYTIGPSIVLPGHENMAGVPDSIFQIDANTGEVKVDYNFENSMTGVFQLDLKVEDTVQHSGTAILQVSVARPDQRLIFQLITKYQDFYPIQQAFIDDLSAILNTQASVDRITDHIGAQAENDDSIDVYVHFTNPETNRVLSADQAINMVNDKLEVIMADFGTEYHLYSITRAVPVAVDDNSDTYTIVLIVVCVVLAVALIIAIGTYIIRVSRLRRMLRAAKDDAFGSKNSDLNRVKVPGADALEGRNPLWENEDLHNRQSIDIRQFNLSIADSDSVNSLQDVGKDEDFQGGHNNPTFPDKLDQLFQETEKSNQDYEPNSLNIPTTEL